MAKAKDFLKSLCEDFECRAYTGIPCKEFKNIYSAMDKDLMHYVPAINADIATGIAIGITLGGFKSAVILDAENFNRMRKDLVVDFEILFILTSDVECEGFVKKKITAKFKSGLKALFSDMSSEAKPGIAVLGKGVLE